MSFFTHLHSIIKIGQADIVPEYQTEPMEEEILIPLGLSPDSNSMFAFSSSLMK